MRPRYPTRSSAYYLLALLTFGYTISFVDRYLLSLLIEPIKDSLALSDLQIGLLLGPAFGILYVALGLPIGWLADRWNRLAIIAVGITIWCLMTAACGLAQSYTQLCLARLGVGVGQATLAPCALSLIGDSFSRNSRSRAVSVYMTGIVLGSGLAFLLGGTLVQHLETLPSIDLPLLGLFMPWQAAFLFAGLPGLILAALIAFVREPRHDLAQTLQQFAPASPATFREMLEYLRAHPAAFGSLIFGTSCVVAIGYTAFWNVSVFQRSWGWDAGAIGVAQGAVLLAAGAPGTLVGGWLADRLVRSGCADGPLRATFLGTLILLPGYVLFPLMPTGQSALALLFVAFFGQSIATAASAAALVTLAPARIRGQVIAVYWLATNLFGLFLGPTPIGWITDISGDPVNLKYAFAIVCGVLGLCGVYLLRYGLPAFRLAVQDTVLTLPTESSSAPINGI